MTSSGILLFISLVALTFPTINAFVLHKTKLYSHNHVFHRLQAVAEPQPETYSHPVTELTRGKQVLPSISSAAIIALSALAFSSQKASAVITKSSPQEALTALLEIKKGAELLKGMEEQARSGEFQKMADTLSAPPFTTFQKNADVLVGCDSITAEDKKALGTIKRYGVIADAIIMMGGLIGELKAGGLEVKGNEGGGLQKSIEDDSEDEDEDDVVKSVNKAEVIKYVKLAYDSFNDIIRIASPSLTK